MDVDRAGLAIPRVRRNDERHRNAREPLPEHQLGEELIRVNEYFTLLLLKQLLRAFAQAFFHRKHGAAFRWLSRFLSAHPKTNVWLRAPVCFSIKETMELSPALSPECPREAVMPPLKSKRPLGSKRNV